MNKVFSYNYRNKPGYKKQNITSRVCNEPGCKHKGKLQPIEDFPANSRMCKSCRTKKNKELWKAKSEGFMF